jgi:carbon monoxide dehydrogenase subunit G
MRLLAASECLIHRPVNEAFTYASNLENFARWFPGVVAIRSQNDLPHGQVGKQYLETVKLPLRGKREVLITVTESQHNLRLVTEGEMPPVFPRMEISFASHGAGHTRVDWRMHSRSQSPVVRVLLLPLARRLMQQRAESGVRRLKRLLEHGAELVAD